MQSRETDKKTVHIKREAMRLGTSLNVLTTCKAVNSLFVLLKGKTKYLSRICNQGSVFFLGF